MKELFFFSSYSQMFLEEAGRKARKEKKKKTSCVKLKNSQNMALLWLIYLSWLLQKHRKHFQALLSLLTERDIYIKSFNATVFSPTFPEYIIENYQTCFVHY